MNELSEKLLRDMLGDLVASKGAARKVITENIVAFVKNSAVQQSVQADGSADCECAAQRESACHVVCDACGGRRR